MTTAEQNEPRPLVLDTYDENDADDRFCMRMLKALVDGSQTPSAIATEVDDWVVRESSRKLQALQERSDFVETDDDGVPLRKAPDAGGYVNRFFQHFPNVCSVFPPYHAGQTRIIQFLEALVAIPEHKAPDYFLDDARKEVHMMTLWLDKGYSTEDLRIRADAIRHPGSGVDVPGSEAEARWRNYQSALARIATTGFSDCGFNSALRDIMPHGKKYPTFKVRVTSKPEDIGGHIQGAAQWIIWPDELRYVYEQCKKKGRVDKKNPRDTWSMENWRIWKAQFEFAAGHERVDARAREVAAIAAEKMNAIEQGRA
ncbi:uncharacterized protein F4812DRAFT_437022 [Daldinia caldariorum]|uniref:uncharacterized protein n=1 Tax=Daldinia caldariorum TaxID=326644 RepID=UPI0020089EE1|nr:uncharacterized protein F4812DRAFT_437022 [Daldinia caldariorum]KAI1465668.1 hypothetical protein F4812DRAFT_437022 [Daldinia caldariorum]